MEVITGYGLLLCCFFGISISISISQDKCKSDMHV